MNVQTDKTLYTLQKGVFSLLQLCISDITSKKWISYGYIEKEFAALIREIKASENILTLLDRVMSYDVQTFIHSVNVTFYTMALAKKKGLTEEEVIEIGTGALLHDIGKLNISLDVLNKEGKLSESEYEGMQKHAEYGELFIENQFSQNILHCATQHHERIDGKGYPLQLMGEQINPFAQILSVADVFDALTSNRPYRKAMPISAAISIIESGSGTQFDEQLVELFMELLSK